MAAEKIAACLDQQKKKKRQRDRDRDTLHCPTPKKENIFLALGLTRVYLLSELSWLTEGRSCVRLESVLEL